MRLNLTITAKDKAKKALSGIANAAKRAGDGLRRAAATGRPGLDRISSSARRASTRLGAMARSAAKAAGRIGLGGLKLAAMGAARGIGFLIGRTIRLGAQLALVGVSLAASLGGWSLGRVITNANTLEQLRFKLGEIDGNAASAARSVGKLREFILNSPVDGDKLIEGYAKLRGLKIKPTTDLFGGLVDASVATGRDLTEVVEAYAGTAKKEFDSLGETLGISVEEAGRRAVIKYDKGGKQLTKKVRNDVASIQAAVKAAMIDKFGGAAGRWQKTWSGMWGALKNKYNEFLNQISDAGLFDWIKDQLGDLLSKITELAQSGKLKEWADEISAKLIEWGKAGKDFIKSVNWTQVGKDFSTIANALGRAVGFLARLIELANKMPPIPALGIGSGWLGSAVEGYDWLTGRNQPKKGAPTPQAPARTVPQAWSPRRAMPAQSQKVSGQVEVLVRTAPGVVATATARSTGPVRTVAKRGRSMAGAA